jgi:hypothetical protein
MYIHRDAQAMSSSASSSSHLKASRTHEEDLGLKQYKLPDDLKGDRLAIGELRRCAQVLRVHEVVDARVDRAEAKARKRNGKKLLAKALAKHPGMTTMTVMPAASGKRKRSPPQRVHTDSLFRESGRVVFKSREAHNEREVEELWVEEDRHLPEETGQSTAEDSSEDQMDDWEEADADDFGMSPGEVEDLRRQVRANTPQQTSTTDPLGQPWDLEWDWQDDGWETKGWRTHWRTGESWKTENWHTRWETQEAWKADGWNNSW